MAELVALFTFVAVSAAAFAIISAPRGVVQRRLATYREMSALDDEDKPEVEPNLMDRVGRPLLETTRRIIRQVLPAGIIESLAWRLVVAGSAMSVNTLIVLWAAAIIGLPFGFLLLVRSTGSGFGPLQMLIFLGLAAIGAYVPRMFLRSQAKKRQKAILKSLPDGIDLLTTSVE